MRRCVPGACVTVVYDHSPSLSFTHPPISFGDAVVISLAVLRSNFALRPFITFPSAAPRGVDVLNLRHAVSCVNHFIAPLVGFFAAA